MEREKLKKFFKSPKTTLTIGALTLALFLFSSAASAAAALTYYSETYSSEVKLYDVGVTLLESSDGTDFKKVTWRNYVKESGEWDTPMENDGVGTLLMNMPFAAEESPEPLRLGYAYPEELKVQNTGTIDEYVRVVIWKYWTDGTGNRLPALDPEFIKLNLTNDSGWIVDEAASTDERTVLYYSNKLAKGGETPFLSESLTISADIAKQVAQKTDGNTITTTYEYDGKMFCIEAEVDAVQAHNAEDAALSAWGREVKVTDGVLTLK